MTANELHHLTDHAERNSPEFQRYAIAKGQLCVPHWPLLDEIKAAAAPLGLSKESLAAEIREALTYGLPQELILNLSLSNYNPTPDTGQKKGK